MPADELAAAERLLARLVARAYAADHPGLFGKDVEPEGPVSGPSSAARADAVAPAARGDGPEGSRSMERDDPPAMRS
jgi:hypothetical protein